MTDQDAEVTITFEEPGRFIYKRVALYLERTSSRSGAEASQDPLITTLNTEGADGWELVSLLEPHDRNVIKGISLSFYILLFKKKISFKKRISRRVGVSLAETVGELEDELSSIRARISALRERAGL